MQNKNDTQPTPSGKIIGRSREQKILKELLESKKAELIALYEPIPIFQNFDF